MFVIPLTVQWWSVWYPGAEPGGGSYIAQRMLASRSEKDAVTGTLLFNVMHYALRPWPWILTALASTLVFPTLRDISAALPYVITSLIGNDIAYPAMMQLSARRDFSGWSWRARSRRTARRSRRISTGARRTSCTISTGAS